MDAALVRKGAASSSPQMSGLGLTQQFGELTGLGLIDALGSSKCLFPVKDLASEATVIFV
jgi:hypothetical protein